MELDPEDGHLRREYAEALRDFGILPEAEQQARKAVELVPESAAAHRVLGQILLSKARDKEGIEAALPSLKRACDLQPAEPSGALALGQAYLRLDRPQEAAAVLARVQDRPRGPILPLLYGEALEKSGKPEEAEEVYLGVLRQDEENRAATLGLLRVYQMTRRFDKALPILAELVESQPGQPRAARRSTGSPSFGPAASTRRRRSSWRSSRRTRTTGTPSGTTPPSSPSGSRRTRADELLKKLQGLEPDDADVAFRRALNFLEARRLDEAETVLNDLRTTLVGAEGAGGRHRVRGRAARIRRPPEEGLGGGAGRRDAPPLRGGRLRQPAGAEPPGPGRARREGARRGAPRLPRGVREAAEGARRAVAPRRVPPPLGEGEGAGGRGGDPRRAGEGRPAGRPRRGRRLAAPREVRTRGRRGLGRPRAVPRRPGPPLPQGRVARAGEEDPRVDRRLREAHRAAGPTTARRSTTSATCTPTGTRTSRGPSTS